jgi:hypothetical protein
MKKLIFCPLERFSSPSEFLGRIVNPDDFIGIGHVELRNAGR